MRSRPLPKIVMSIAATGLVLSACADAPEDDRDVQAGEGFPVAIETCGFESTIQAAPERAITMNQGATEIVLALGLHEQLIGTAYLDDEIPEKWQDAYNSVDVLSDAYPNSEAVLEVDPDLILGSYSSAFGPDAAGPREELEDEGIATLLSVFGCEDRDLRADPTFESVWDELDLVAEAFGQPEAAQQFREDQQALLDELAATAAGDGLTVFWYDGGTDVPTAGVGFGGPQAILNAVGATNIFAHVEGSWSDVTWEDVVAADPDIIVFADADWSTAADKQAYLENDPVLRELSAVVNSNYVSIPFSESTPGVRLADGAASVSEQIIGLDLR